MVARGKRAAPGLIRVIICALEGRKECSLFIIKNGHRAPTGRPIPFGPGPGAARFTLAPGYLL